MVKKSIYISLAVFTVLLLIIGFALKDKLNEYISEQMIKQSGIENKSSVENYVKEEYNYTKNGKDYQFTLLEFSSSGCTICKQMEPVLEEVKSFNQPKVNVVFLHIMKPENLGLMKYFGISAVPMQILLDNQGNEFFRHYGFISAKDLKLKLNQNPNS